MKRKHLLILMLMALLMPLALNAQSSLPFSENFNSVPVNQLPNNWTLSSTQVGTVTAVVQKETPTSTNRILLMGVTQLYNGNGALAVQIPTNAIGKYYVKMTFKLMPTSATSGTFKVICATTNFSNPIEIATYNASDLTVGSWNYITVPVTLPSNRTITFMVTTTAANSGWAIDDVSVTDGYKPTNVTTSVLEPNYATISWDYSGTSGYEMQYRMQGETDWITYTTPSNHYAISELLPNHTYEAQVRGYQGTYYTGWSDLLTFTTPDAYYDFSVVIPNSNQYLYYKVTDSYNHVKVVSPYNSFSDPWGTIAKPEGNVAIPQTVTYGGVTYTVTAIGNNALKDCTDVTGISIPSTVTTIGDYAFANCKLTSLTIPSSVTNIDVYAFYQCGDNNGMSVNIVGNATTGTTIQTMAFLKSKVNELTLGEGVTFVGDKAFWGCSLLTTLHFNATNCTQMRSTYNSAYYSVFNSGNDITTHPAITTLTIGSNATNIPDYAFYDFASLTSVAISEGVTSIGNQAFWNCPNLATVNFNATNCTNMKTTLNSVSYSSFNSGSDNTTNPAVTTLNIGNNVTNIPDYAFYGFTSLPEVTISEGVTSIGERAFWKCPNLTTVHFNATNCTNMKTTYYYVLRSPFNSGTDNTTNPAIITLTIGSNVTRIPEYAFYDADQITTGLIIPSSVQYIEECAFKSCSRIPSLVFENGSQLESIDEEAFNYCDDMSGILRLPNSLTEIGYWSFSHCGFWKVVIPSSVTSIAASAFNSCGSSMVVEIAGNPTSGTTIGNYAFYNSDIVELTIGEGVISIGEQAFWKCPNLTTVHFNAINCTNMMTTYNNGTSDLSLSPFNSGDDENSYPAITTLTIGDNVTRIPKYAFYHANSISNNLIIPSSVQYIEESAFAYCKKISGLSFAEDAQLVSIGTSAFYYCERIKGTLRFPNSLTEIGGWTFCLSGLFSKIIIPSSVTSIGTSAFNSCNRDCYQGGYRLIVEIAGNPTSGTTIGNDAFRNSDIVELTIGEGVTSIGNEAFWNCQYLTTVHFNAVNCTHMSTAYTDGSITYHYSPFNSGEDNTTNPAITTLTIGSNVTRIPAYAFYGANQISSNLTIPSSVQYIEEYAFKFCSSIPNISFAEGSQLESIGEQAFYYCDDMSGNLWLPNSLTEIGYRAFYHCGFWKVVIPSSVTSIAAAAFHSCGSDMVVEIAGNPTSGTTIGNYAFNSSDIKELTIGECVTSIGEQAFWNCPNLTKVHFNAINCTHMSTTYTDGDNTYHRSVFNSGEDLTTSPVITVLTLGENVTYIPEYAFYDCQTAPVKLNIPNVTAVGDGAFYNCMLATDLNLGNSVVTIGMKAFENCSNITGDLIIPHATTFIGASAFCDAGLNGALALGQNVNSLGSAAFKNCNFTSIVIGKGNSSEPNNITTAEANTFDGVRNYIPVYRPYGTNYPTATGWNHFTNYLTEYQLNGGAWSVASNWSQNNVPGADDVVLINGNSHISSNTSPTVKSLYIANGDAKTLKIYDGAMLTVTDGIYNTDPSKLIVNDGGQLITPKVTAATVERKTSASEAKTYNNWYAIASPVNEESIEDFVKGTHNVYRYNEPTIMWQEYRVPVNQFSKLTNGQGYLYRSTEANIALDGDINVGDVKVWLSKECSNTRYQGFNLIGNPYPHNIYKGGENAAIPNGDLLEDKYCVLGVNGNWVLTDDGTAITPGTAILVQAKAQGELTMRDVTTGAAAKRGENDNIWFTVSNDDYEDVACVEFREGRGFNKMAHYNADAPMLYINYNGEDFASVDVNADVKMLNLCFKAKAMGKYTLNYNANGQFSYLHLIDRLTGNDVDMLVENEYSFIGTASDNANRFIVKLSYNGDDSDENFVYQSGDDLVVSGEGELQVYDVMGRMIASQRVNGVETVRKPDQTGVYIIKLNEKTQKIVVR
ncbi:MAG: leucine-rich repeat protein [Bacteroidales bacterium]|nr:leucine-rich repeat protein [Bacteroidales bacterium]